MTSRPNDADSDPSLEELLQSLFKVLIEAFQRHLAETPRQQPLPSSPDQALIMSNFRFMLDELRREYDLMLETRKIIEQKASTVITISGVIISLLFGFTIYVNSVNSPSEPVGNILRLTPIEVAIIIAGLVSVVVALVLSSISLKLGKNIATTAISGYFVNKNGQPNWASIDQSSRMPEVDHYRRIIARYSDNIQLNKGFNLKKGSLIFSSQIALLIGIILVGVALILVYVKYLQ